MAGEIPPGTPFPSERPCERHAEVHDFVGQRIASGPCVDRNGNTLPHPAYIFPSRINPLLKWSVAAGVLLPVVVLGLYAIGRPARVGGGTLRAVLSPGATFSRHSLATMDCAQCHRTAHAVQDGRCERCHDTAVSARLSHAAHVFQGTDRNLSRALAAPAVSCATCHVEHRGADVRLASVDNGECGACHRVERNAMGRLTSLARHPEFSLVEAGVETGSGLRWFNHQLHVGKVRDKFRRECEFCHEPTQANVAFSPISFPRHCASCHEEDLGEATGALASGSLAAIGPLPSPLGLRPDLDDATRVVVTGLRHADPWVLSTVQALRGTMDVAAVAADRITLDREVAQLELLLDFARPGRGVPAIRPAPVAGGLAAPASDEQSVREAATAVEALVTALGDQSGAARALLSDAGRLKQAAPPTASPSASVATAASDATAALRRLIAAVIARAQAAGNQDLVQRATALQQRLDRLPSAAALGFEAIDPLVTGLLEALRAAADPRVRSEAARLITLARVARGQAAGGIDPAAFDLHRAQSLRLLDAVQQSLSRQAQRPDLEQLLTRVAALRQNILGVQYGTDTHTGAIRSRFFTDRMAERTSIDAELESAGQRLPPPAQRAAFDAQALQWRLDRLRPLLAAAGSRRRLAGSVRADEAQRVITALIGAEASDAEANALQKNRCTLCHELAPKGDQLAAIRSVGTPLLIKATFTHAPHLSADGRNCETCHTRIRQSAGSREVNLPAVASCVNCHAPGKSAAKAVGCQSCHRYHATADNTLIWTP